ncbi:MAG: hypothetical protein HY900_12190 [Deltaproteobacteria bacterium]|nr:hypothetical protein [Deltaproteobacteria bacterium]
MSVPVRSQQDEKAKLASKNQKGSPLGYEAQLWQLADALRGSMDAAEYKHARIKVSRVGDVAFTSKGTIGRFARIGATTERFVHSPQVCFWPSLDKSKLHPAVLYCWMQSQDLPFAGEGGRWTNGHGAVRLSP